MKEFIWEYMKFKELFIEAEVNKNGSASFKEKDILEAFRIFIENKPKITK